MKRVLLFLFLVISYSGFGNVKYINIEKIQNFQNFSSQFKFITDHVKYYDHWSQEWNYPIAKSELMKELENCYDLFLKNDTTNLESILLLGDISHYLYNLDVEKYYSIACRYYQNAIALYPNDYRSYWFLAYHYSLSNKQIESIQYLLKAEALLPPEVPAAFWDEYALATAIAKMPSHSIFAMEKAKEISGKPSFTESQLGVNIRNQLKAIKSDTSILYKNLWSADQGDLLAFVSRALGLKFVIDSTWKLQFFDYKKFATGLMITPPALKGKNNKEITYSIGIIINIARKENNLEEFVKKFTASYKTKNKIAFTSKYQENLAYEVKDMSTYQNMGGAHMVYVGIEQKNPKYPGLKLENPHSLPEGNTGMNYYRIIDSKTRFKENIDYLVMLDVCEDIYEDAYKIFKNFFDNQLVIE